MSRFLAGPCASFALLLAAPACAALAGDIYRWTDDKGRTHMSDQVPEAYRDKATRIDSRNFELSPQQRAESERRTAREKAADDKARREAQERERAAEASPSATARKPASAASGARSAGQAESDCDKRWRQYLESQRCFGPYRVANGGIRAEAFQNCVEYPDPSRQCGNMKPTTLPDSQ